jgi:hypothetical protein
MGPMGAAVGATGVIFLVAAIILPEAADGLLRLFVATLAFVVVGVRAFQAVLPVRTAQDFYSPFEDDVSPRDAAPAPQLLRTLRAELDGADDAAIARRKAVPSVVRDLVMEEAGRRLSEGHGLLLNDAAHHDRIRALVSAATWGLIRPSIAARGAADPSVATAVPLSQLDLILDDVERL